MHRTAAKLPVRKNISAKLSVGHGEKWQTSPRQRSLKVRRAKSRGRTVAPPPKYPPSKKCLPVNSDSPMRLLGFSRTAVAAMFVLF